MTRLSILCASTIIMAGCGGGSAGDVPTADATGTAPQATVLGSRDLPGGTVTMTTPNASPRGGSSTIALTFAGEIAPVSAELLVGTDYEGASPAALTTTADGWSATIGNPGSGEALLVRLVFADGSVTESAIGDFRLP